MSMLDRIAKALLGGKVGGATPEGIRMYHSSPYDIEKFDWGKLRSGQGANTYGAGFYGAESPKVSGQGGEYWNEFSRRFSGPEWDAAEALRTNNFDRAAAIDSMKVANDFWQKRYNSLPEGLKDNPRLYGAPTSKNIAQGQEAIALLESGQPIGPRTYELNYRAQPSEMLNWDAPIPRTTIDRLGPGVRDALENLADQHGVNSIVDVPEAYKGRDLYKQLGHHDVHESLPGEIGPSSWYTGNTTEAAHTSQYLNSLGIPGISYLDAGSRARGQLENRLSVLKDDAIYAEANKVGMPEKLRGQITSLENQLAAMPPATYNHVMFDPSKIDIMAKYGVVGGVPIGMGALAAQDQYGAQQ